MPASMGYLVIDASDPERPARFWCGLLDVGVETTVGDGQFVVLSAAKDGLPVGDLDQATAEAEALGGWWLEPGSTRELEGSRWWCMADPEGNESGIDVAPSG